MHFKSAEVRLCLPKFLRVVVPRIRLVADAFPVAAPCHLVRLGHALPVVELLAHVDHAKF